MKSTISMSLSLLALYLASQMAAPQGAQIIWTATTLYRDVVELPSSSFDLP
jgi:hypothetical protein